MKTYRCEDCKQVSWNGEECPRCNGTKMTELKIPEGYPTKCEKCGGKYRMGMDVWASRVRCEDCLNYYDL